MVAWYIPPDWIARTDSRPKNILEAAQIAAEVANSTPHLFLDHSTIPRMIHQTWKSTNLEDIPIGTLPDIESWLHYATHSEYPSMAYFMWDDEGIALLLATMDAEIRKSFYLLPKAVEKADVFRTIVCNTFGGIVSSENQIEKMNNDGSSRP